MDKNKFKKECHQQLVTYFILVKRQKIDEAMIHRIQGFIKAGVFLKLISSEETLEIMEDAHHEVFGISIEQRKARKDAIKSVLQNDDFSVFDTPAIERLGETY